MVFKTTSTRGYFYEVPVGNIKKKDPMLHPVHVGHGLANTKRVWYGYRFGIVAGYRFEALMDMEKLEYRPWYNIC